MTMDGNYCDCDDDELMCVWLSYKTSYNEADECDDGDDDVDGTMINVNIAYSEKN